MEEREIIERCLNGETDCFSYIVLNYKKLVYSIALRFLKDPDAAEDITQEVFLKAYKKLHMYDRNMKFSAWIGRITHNTCIDAIRRNKNHLTVSTEEQDVQAYGVSPDETVIKKERKEWLEEQIRLLAPGYKTPLLLFHKGGLSYEEIAKSMNVPISIVKNRIYRARKMLKEKMASYYGEE